MKLRLRKDDEEENRGLHSRQPSSLLKAHPVLSQVASFLCVGRDAPDTPIPFMILPLFLLGRLITCMVVSLISAGYHVKGDMHFSPTDGIRSTLIVSLLVIHLYQSFSWLSGVKTCCQGTWYRFVEVLSSLTF